MTPAIIHAEGDGFVALCPELDIASQGDTIERARDNLREALELLARRAGIVLKSSDSPQLAARARMHEALRWAAQLYHDCLLDSTDAGAEAARRYLGGRGLTGETVRRWQLGFAPNQGDWLARQTILSQARRMELRELEQGEVDLEDSIALYERGTALKQHCEKKLKGAEARLEKIVLGAEGAKGVEPMDL